MISLLLAVVVTSCITCHEDQAVKLKNDVHAVVGLLRIATAASERLSSGTKIKRSSGNRERVDTLRSAPLSFSPEYMKRFTPAAGGQGTEYAPAFTSRPRPRR